MYKWQYLLGGFLDKPGALAAKEEDVEALLTAVEELDLVAMGGKTSARLGPVTELKENLK